MVSELIDRQANDHRLSSSPRSKGLQRIWHRFCVATNFEKSFKTLYLEWRMNVAAYRCALSPSHHILEVQKSGSMKPTAAFSQRVGDFPWRFTTPGVPNSATCATCESARRCRLGIDVWLVVEPTHLKNILIKMGSSSPSSRGEKQSKNMWVATTKPSYFLGPSNDHPWPTITHEHSMVNWWFWLLGLKSLHAKTRNHQDHLVFRIPPEPLAVQQPRKIHIPNVFQNKQDFLWKMDFSHIQGAHPHIVHVDLLLGSTPHPLLESARVIFHWRLGFTLPLSFLASNHESQSKTQILSWCHFTPKRFERVKYASVCWKTWSPDTFPPKQGSLPYITKLTWPMILRKCLQIAIHFKLDIPPKWVAFNAPCDDLNDFPEFLPSFPNMASRNALWYRKGQQLLGEVFSTRKSGGGFLENPCQLWDKLGKILVNYGINSEKSL